MTVRVSRTFTFEAAPEDVWSFIADPGKRASVISVVESYEVHDDRHATWHIRLPIPVIRSTIDVETREIERDPPNRVKFVGRSRAFRVTGEHTIVEEDGTSRLENEFVVEGRLPGVERFFERNFEAEIENLERALHEDVAAGATD
ncbi:CoxG family protein [Halopenitus persicus]|uniref:Carbon monoxide dehydrogenase subunit G n=1 Tax=Halopenitus persicus TaxID=1048396 RepID=A0A1H3JXE8_9EURY|nr:SRPBCC family protein [Halopenitus persicus]QHS15716.1 polyketide cyclase [haloarchaeon 3A1-DGR]SDY44596.1 Carbon monoxide dehydrogenase subunit G [Halopenitus persicus]